MTILFAWDFHGVLEQGNELAVLKVTNQSLREHGYEDQATLKDIKRLYGLPWRDYFRQLVPNVTEDKVEKRARAYVKGKKDETIRSHAESGNYSKIVVIGDTERDIEAGLTVNATTYLVLNGEPWRSKAHHIITDIREILREL